MYKYETLLFLCILLSSCGNYSEQKSEETTLSIAQLGELSSSFDNVKKTVFEKRCLECHQQYDSYDGVIRELSSIQSAIYSDRMPKNGGPLTSSQKAVFFDWITNGVPNIPGEVSKPPRVTLEPYWKSISQNIIIPKCLVCHNPEGQARFLDLSTRQIIFDSRNRIFSNGSRLLNFDNAEQSYMIQILRDEEEPMPPVWSNILRLKAEEVQVIKEWISLGLP